MVEGTGVILVKHLRRNQYVWQYVLFCFFFFWNVFPFIVRVLLKKGSSDGNRLISTTWFNYEVMYIVRKNN